MSAPSPESILLKLHNTLVSLLLVVGHPQKEAQDGAAELENTILFVALTYLVLKEPKPKRDETLKQVQESKDRSKAIQIILKNAKSADDVVKYFSQATHDVMDEYFKAIGKTLTQEQVEKIDQIMNDAKTFTEN